MIREQIQRLPEPVRKFCYHTIVVTILIVAAPLVIVEALYEGSKAFGREVVDYGKELFEDIHW